MLKGLLILLLNFIQIKIFGCLKRKIIFLK
jgi:hypothetical protein